MASRSPAEHMDGEEQLQAIRANDEAALQQLYRTHYPSVERFVMQNSGTADQARDVYQEAFLAVWRNIQMGRFQLQTGSGLGAYLFRIAKNKWMDQLRSAHHTKVVLLEPDDQLQADDHPQTEDDEYLKAVRTYFPKLGDNCRKVLGLFYFRDEPMKRIAELMGWTEQTARNNKYRCLEKLRSLIHKNH